MKWPEDNQFHEVVLWASRKITSDDLSELGRAARSILDKDGEGVVYTFADFHKTREIADLRPETLEKVLD
jgi:hypothetical protein